MKKHTNYKNRISDVIEACKSAETFSDVERALGVTTPNRHLRAYIKLNDIPMPNYKGMKAGYERAKGTRYHISLSDFRENKLMATHAAKRFLIRNGLKTEACEICGWCEKRESDKKIPVHLHHINGVNTDWRIENIQILCPNHHALTSNYSGCNSKKG